MNHKRNILMLTITLTALTFICLLPGINEARQTAYVRVYEDTESVSDGRTKNFVEARLTADTTRKEKRKRYKREKINTGGKLKQLHPSMFSRVMHFVEEPLQDSLSNTVSASLPDSVKVRK